MVRPDIFDRFSKVRAVTAAGLPFGRTWMAVHYGRRKGWLRHCLYRTVYAVGGFREFRRVKWHNVRRLVFVCYGNICRSPYAEAKAHELGIEATSCGVGSDGKSPANALAIKIGLDCGVDLSKHSARTFDGVVVSRADLLIAMEPWHGKCLRELVRTTGAQATLLGLWSSEVRPHLEDPFGLSEEYFRNCFALIDSAVENIASRMFDWRNSVRGPHGA